MKERAVIVCAWEAEVFTMKELCEHFGVSQKTGYKWVPPFALLHCEGGRVESWCPVRAWEVSHAAKTSPICIRSHLPRV